MDALMAALAAALLLQPGDRVPWLAAILADRYRRPGLVTAAALVAVGAAGTVAAWGGALAGAHVTPEVRQLFLALALLAAGAGALFPVRAPDRLEGWRLPAGATAATGLFVLAFGDALQVAVAALAAGAALFWLPAAGAALGAAAAAGTAAYLGERGWRALPLRSLRLAGAAVLLLWGAAAALRGLRLA